MLKTIRPKQAAPVAEIAGFVQDLLAAFAESNAGQLLTNQTIKSQPGLYKDGVEQPFYENLSLRETDDIASNMQLGAREFGASIPTIIHNFSAISDSLRDSADFVVDSVDLIGTGISETVYNVKERSGDVVSYVKIIVEALHYIVNYLKTK